MHAVTEERLRQAASRYPEARLIVLFGSVARGDALAWSDADVAVSGLPFWRALALGSDVAAAIGREPHVVDLDSASDWLRYQVARDGVVLAAHDTETWPRFQAEAALRYFDLQPILALCAEGARRRLLAGDA